MSSRPRVRQGYYEDTFHVATGGPRSPEEWARAAFEGAPPPVRLFLLFGWRAVLGLRLGPRPSAEHVLGWRITNSGSETIHLTSRSPLMAAQLVMRVEGPGVTLSTHVSFEGRGGRPVWALVGPIHRRLIPYLLGRAARR